VILEIYRGCPGVPPAELAGFGVTVLTRWELLLLDTASEEDLALANACIAIECELQGRGYAAVGRLGTLLRETTGELLERVLALPTPVRIAALAELYELGWVYA
jgi:hypothetical protein